MTNHAYVLEQLEAGTQAVTVAGAPPAKKFRGEVRNKRTGQLIAKAFAENEEQAINLAIEAAATKAGVPSEPTTPEGALKKRVAELEKANKTLASQVDEMNGRMNQLVEMIGRMNQLVEMIGDGMPAAPPADPSTAPAEGEDKAAPAPEGGNVTTPEPTGEDKSEQKPKGKGKDKK